MTADDLDAYLRRVGFTVDTISDSNGARYTVIRAFEFPRGSLAGRITDVAIQRCEATPYVTPSAIHTCPALLPMGTRNTQASALGADWQYWSRRFDHAPSPERIWTHILTILTEV
jgi:hypothetical protein